MKCKCYRDSVPLPRVPLLLTGLVPGLYLRQLEVAQQIPHGVQEIVDGVSEVGPAPLSTSSPGYLRHCLGRGVWVEVGQQGPEEHPQGAGVVNSCGLSLRGHVGVDGVDWWQRVPSQHGGVLEVSREVGQHLLVVVGDDDVPVNISGKS